jgi:hypothetical protein
MIFAWLGKIVWRPCGQGNFSSILLIWDVPNAAGAAPNFILRKILSVK